MPRGKSRPLSGGVGIDRRAMLEITRKIKSGGENDLIPAVPKDELAGRNSILEWILLHRRGSIYTFTIWEIRRPPKSIKSITAYQLDQGVRRHFPDF
jgi:hypothetical protein